MTIPDREGNRNLSVVAVCPGKKTTCNIRLNKDKSVMAQFR